jgi:hypothetical protein
MKTEEGERIEKIETTIVESDIRRSPWDTKPDRFKAGLVSPVLKYLNGQYWMVLQHLPGMRNLLHGFEVRPMPELMALPFATKSEGFKILEALRNQGVLVKNWQELQPKIMGKVPCNPLYPQSLINVPDFPEKKTAGVRTAGVPGYDASNKGQVKQVLAYNPSQQDIAVARGLLVRATEEVAKLYNKKDKIKDIQVLAAAKMLGLFGADPAAIDLYALWRQSSRFALDPSNRAVLTQQLSSVVESPAPSMVTPEPGAVQPPGSQESPIIDELESGEPGPQGIPISLEVGVLGSIRNGKLRTLPHFYIAGDDAFVHPGMKEQAIKILTSLRVSEDQELGFIRQGIPLIWVGMGQTTSQVKKMMRIFSKRLVAWEYTLTNFDKYLETMKAMGFSDAEIESIWPKAKVASMMRIARLVAEHPEYRNITELVFS